MAQDWLESSEISFGRILIGKLSPNSVDPEKFMAPYNEMVKFIKSKPDWSETDLIAKGWIASIRIAYEAVRNLNGMGDKVDWPQLLDIAHLRHEVGNDLESASKKLKRGAEIDVPALQQSLSKLSTGYGSLVRMSDVEATDMRLIPTGWKPLDTHIGGLPEAGMTTLLGPPKMGKTSLACTIIACFTHTHKKKQTLVVTKEMLEGQFKKRTLEVSTRLTEEDQKRIILNHDAQSVHQVATLAATIDNLGLIVVDFADMLIGGSVDPAKMEEVYRVLALLASNLRVPVILLAQLSGGYPGGLPRPHHARWTRMAEALTWMFMVVYAPSRDWHSDKEKLLRVASGKSYIGFWMCRSATNNELPGAIETIWRGDTGWSNNTGKWIPLSKTANDDDEEEIEDTEWASAYN